MYSRCAMVRLNWRMSPSPASHITHETNAADHGSTQRVGCRPAAYQAAFCLSRTDCPSGVAAQYPAMVVSIAGSTGATDSAACCATFTPCGRALKAVWLTSTVFEPKTAH